MSEETISEEQVLHNKLSFEINQELIHLMKRIIEIQQENTRLKTNWNELKNYISEKLKDRICDELYYEAFLDMNIKMKELEGNNE